MLLLCCDGRRNDKYEILRVFRVMSCHVMSCHVSSVTVVGYINSHRGGGGGYLVSSTTTGSMLDTERSQICSLASLVMAAKMRGW